MGSRGNKKILEYCIILSTEKKSTEVVLCFKGKGGEVQMPFYAFVFEQLFIITA